MKPTLRICGIDVIEDESLDDGEVRIVYPPAQSDRFRVAESDPDMHDFYTIIDTWEDGRPVVARCDNLRMVLETARALNNMGGIPVLDPPRDRSAEIEQIYAAAAGLIECTRWIKRNTTSPRLREMADGALRDWDKVRPPYTPPPKNAHLDILLEGLREISGHANQHNPLVKVAIDTLMKAGFPVEEG